MNDLHEILKILESDARLSAMQIADMVGRPVEDVEAAIRKAEKDGVIRRYKAVIHWDQAGKERVFAFIDAKVTPTRGRGFDDIAERICRFPEVQGVYLVSGDYDLRIIIKGASMQEVANFVSNKLSTIERINATASHFVLKRYKEDGELLFPAEEDQRLAVTP